MSTSTTGSFRPKPHILLLIDEWNWAFHTIAESVVRHASDHFSFEILCTRDEPLIDESRFDIIHVFFETETYHRKFLQGKAKILKGVYSHYWQLQGLTPDAFYAQSLYEADAVAVPSRKLLEALGPIPCPVYLFPEGVDTEMFDDRSNTRSQCVGWAGSDIPIKRLEMVRAACGDEIALRTSIGNERAHEEMPAFYGSIDIIVNASVAEGCPRPLLEGMACGAFPVLFDVGIAPELIRSGYNGLIVQEQSASALRDALLWCRQHPDILEKARPFNRELMRATRRWENVIPSLVDIYRSLLA